MTRQADLRVGLYGAWTRAPRRVEARFPVGLSDAGHYITSQIRSATTAPSRQSIA